MSEVGRANASITSPSSPLMEIADSTFPLRICCRMELMADNRGLTTCSIPMVDMSEK